MERAMKSQSDIHAEGSMTGTPFLRYPMRSSNAGKSSTNRLEIAWAWASLLMLIICWDAALRLDQRVSVSLQNALIPVSARPTVSWWTVSVPS